MADVATAAVEQEPRNLFEPAVVATPARGIWLVPQGSAFNGLEGLSAAQRHWLSTQSFSGQAKRQVLVPGPNGETAGVVLGLGDKPVGEPCGPCELLIGQLAGTLPAGSWMLAGTIANPELATIAWGLGAYKFRRYKQAGESAAAAVLRLPTGVDLDRVTTIVEGAWLGRDLINTPSNDMGPEELEAACVALANRHGATVTSISGDDVLERGFRLLHAVGRASPRRPRLIDLVWGRADAPKVTLVGKGICFDTGGLDIKPANGMLIMKKDMGGAATALALGHMIMGLKLDVRLRVLIVAAENSIAGNAFRPGDVITSRSGKTVEIGNTDAEGRLVLADALSLADEEAPDTLITFATLTGAARVALGPDLAALFCNDNRLAATIEAAGLAVGDPLWRMPFWAGYERNLDSDIADMNNVHDSPFGGAITAALFLQRFVSKARRYAHIDMYGWRQAPRPLSPKGGEATAARAVLAALQQMYAVN